MAAFLKSLELHGYKTFASKSNFEFAQKVTAIVGPNGSGKSNIADALRWVLGEQSYSLLRGRKTEDMIFSGSEGRPRAGMASATVLFDNSEGWLPIDFSEVSVSRRAYRDGQNEYLINGQRVRLRDVSEMLAKSGLAERTYTIIGQGLVDAALALRADERRRLFEEAAGIGLYRSRKEESLRRLETTRRNLDRVQDILAEIRPRLRSLDRQARRAREYEQVKDDLRQVLLEWYGYHWHRSQRSLVEAQSTAREHELVLEDARKRQDALDEELTGDRDRVQSLRAALGDLHKSLAEAHAERESITRELAVLDERRRALQATTRDRESMREQVGAEVEFAQSRLADSQAAVLRGEEELKAAQEQAQAAADAFAAKREDRSRIEADAQQAREVLAEQNARRTALGVRQDELQARLARQAEYQAAGDQALQQAEAALDEAQKLLEERQAEFQKASADRAQMEREFQETERQAEELRQSRQALAARLAETQASMARLQARLDVLVQAERAMIGYGSGVRLLLQAARQSQLSGLRGALRDYLQVAPEVETAVAAALGAHLDAVLLDSQADVDQALTLLEQSEARAALLPLDVLARLPGFTAPKDEDCLGLASELVDTRPELRPAVDLLLSRVIVVRDRAAARRLLAGQPPGTRAATMKGEVFHAEGPIHAGIDSGAGVLGRPRQKEEIEAQLGQSAASLKELEAEGEGLQSRMQSAQQDAGDAARRLEVARSAEATAQDSLRIAQAELDAARRQQAWQAEQRRNLDEEAESARRELEEIQAQLGTLNREIQEADRAVVEASRRLKEAPLDEFRSQATYWELQVSVAQRMLAEARQREQERAAVIARAQDRREEVKGRLVSLAQEEESLDAQQAGLRAREEEVSARIAALGEKISPAEAELAQVEGGLESYRAEELRIRQGVTQAERNYTHSQIKLARQTEALETLRHRIEDDFGLVAFAYEDEISGPTPLPLDGMVEQLPVVTELGPDAEDSLKRLRAQLRRIGAVNPEAQREYEEVRERFEFLQSQTSDLEAAESHILQVIAELDQLMEREFRKTFDAVAAEFKEIFSRLFGGGSARLVLTDPEDMTETGIDIVARLPGRRTQGLSLLSGGERSLTATALVFALLKVSPTPFCVLDEVDAMLDEANIGRFRDLLRELSQETQFILITHNRGTVQVADVIYGITMGHDSTSQVLSLKLDQVAEVVPG